MPRSREMKLRRATLVGSLFVVFSVNGCGGSLNKASPDGGDAGFIPALIASAPDPCGLLTFADVQTLLPNVSAMVSLDPLIVGDLWRQTCQWGSPATNPGEIVELELAGALTPAGEAVFASNLTPIGYPDASVETVTGLGTKAAYIDAPGVLQSLTALYKSYQIWLGTRFFTLEVPEASLHPLALKVLGEL